MLEMPVQDKLLTADEFMELPDRYIELIDGRVVHLMPPLLDHALFASRIVFALESFNRRQRLGYVFTEGSFRVEAAPQKVRAPDVCFIQNADLEGKRLDTYFDGGPTLAIEIVSKHDSLDDTRDKVDAFLQAGSKVAWIVYPKEKCVFVRTLDEPEIKYEIGQGILGGDILPGFALAVADIFEN